MYRQQQITYRLDNKNGILDLILVIDAHFKEMAYYFRGNPTFTIQVIITSKWK